MAAVTSRGIPLSSINGKYLYTNSTSHTWPFSAIAELIDNAYDPDVSAKQLWIDKSVIKDQDCLIFMDNGNGMDYDKMHKMLSFGFSDKQTVNDHDPVGLYGNGFKTGSMRLGKDAIVFSKKDSTMCVGLLSQTYLMDTGAQNVIVPIAMFTNTGQTVSASPEHAEECLHDILKHSLFNTKEELLSEFSVIDGLCTNSSGTRIIIWNLRRTPSGELEFDFTKNRHDIRIPVDVYGRTGEKNKRQAAGGESVPESEYSLRAYCSILYLKPRMQIIIQGLKVETQLVTKTLANVLTDTYTPASVKKAIPITFGYNTKSKEHYGLMMYYNNRLIKAYERVACQRKADGRAVGVIGVIECNHLTPAHNKQEFNDPQGYRKILKNVGKKLEEYWKRNYFVYDLNPNCTEPFEDTGKQPDQKWVQCNDCLKWRKLPDGIDPKTVSKKWFCHMNSDPQFRSCTDEEEPMVSDDEQPRYQKTNKQHERNQKLQQENRQQTLFTPTSSIHTPRPSDGTSADPHVTSLSNTSKRKNKIQDQDRSQENPKKKKARRTGFQNNKPNLSTYLEDLEEENATNSVETSNPRREKENNINLQIWKKIQDTTRSKRGHRDNNTQQQFLCSHAGQFHCKLTNLVFEMKGNGEVLYTIVSWDNIQLQGTGQFQPAGPLYNIDCSEGSILNLHLPHCEIQTDKSPIELVVAHFSEGKMEILQPLKVTNTHVIVEVKHLSLFGLLKKKICQETPIRAQVLLFYQNMKTSRKLHIYLLPENVSVKEVQNQHDGNTYSSTICQLTPGKKYRPLTPNVSQPEVETFGCNYGPKYQPTFEVILNTGDEDLTLGLLDEFGQEVWVPKKFSLPAEIREEVPAEIYKGAEFVDKHRDVLIQRVLSVPEITDTLLTKKIMTTERCSAINEATTPQEKMRKLYIFLDSGGKVVKEEFYKLLKEKERFIVDELESLNNA